MIGAAPLMFTIPLEKPAPARMILRRRQEISPKIAEMLGTIAVRCRPIVILLEEVCLALKFLRCVKCLSCYQGSRQFERDNNNNSSRRNNEHGNHNGNGGAAEVPLPEDDDKATRTLFVGNLEPTVTEALLRSTFSKYGLVQDVDVKRPMGGELWIKCNKKSRFE